MSRLFVTSRELNLISDLTKECVKDVIGQRIFYYPISEIKTRTHELYSESPEKIYDNPIEINALVDQPANNTNINLFGPERLNTIEVYIHQADLVDRRINLAIGDFLRYGEFTYEISKLINMGNIYGHVENSSGYKLVCTQARTGQFNPPHVGPTDTQFSDKDALQTDFIQQRGSAVVDDKPTGDVRALQQNGVLEPIVGPAQVNNKNGDPAGESFYDES